MYFIWPKISRGVWGAGPPALPVVWGAASRIWDAARGVGSWGRSECACNSTACHQALPRHQVQPCFGQSDPGLRAIVKPQEVLFDAIGKNHTALVDARRHRQVI